VEVETIDFQAIPVSPFRLFGSTTNSNHNSNPSKKLSTTDKLRRKRTQKLDEHSDGQKVKRGKSDMNINQQKMSSDLLPTQSSLTIEKKQPIEPLIATNNKVEYS
jgi:hypothetical protein